MGRHAEWRKLAKKLRRKRIRSALASKRDEIIQKEKEMRERSPTYQSWIEEQDVMELFRIAEEERQAKERQKEWEEEEKAAAIRWQEQQIRLAQARAEKAKQEMLIREEWEREQKKLKEAEDVKKKAEQVKKKKEEEVLAKIDAFISGQGQFPAEADISTETQPGHPVCPFFSKTGACRFKDNCSRNHIRPGISKVLLIPNFYEYLGIQALHQSEYDTDVGLEYEESETYQHFLEFYNDILPEFEECGQVTLIKVCSNEEPHLRGNVYVEYSKERYAMRAYRRFQGRYYAGRQISVEFCNIPSWKNAICGLFHVHRCPKGRTCNFLHVFGNPKKSYNGSHGSTYHYQSRSCSRSRSRSQSYNKISKENWNWSDSSDSENDARKWRNKSRNRKRDTRNDERTRRNQSERKKGHRKERRSKSPKREKRKFVSQSNIISKSDDSYKSASEKLSGSKNDKKHKSGCVHSSHSEKNIEKTKEEDHIRR